ncbi:MAG TPA: transcriptional regulator, partial [bacterium]|nr:transcriptional regulator [bacterium]
GIVPSMSRRAGAQASRWMLILDRLTSTRTGLTVNELADEFSCTRRTIYRDFEQIESWLGAPLVREGEDDEHAGTRWRLLDGTKFRPAIEFAPSELLSLLAASELLKPLAATPWGLGLSTLQAKLRGRLHPDTVKKIEAEAAELAAAPRAAPDFRKHAATVETLMRAVRDHATVEMRYHSLSSGQTTTRKLDPYRLWYADNALYAVGACHVHDMEVRTFAIDRIKAIKTTGERFTIPKDFQWEAYTRDSFRLFRGGDPVEVVIDFAPGIAPVLRERKYHPSQTAEDLPDGGVRVKIRVAGLFEVVGWVLGFGAQARVVAPAELVRVVKDEIAKTATLYEAPAPKGKPARTR